MFLDGHTGSSKSVQTQLLEVSYLASSEEDLRPAKLILVRVLGSKPWGQSDARPWMTLTLVSAIWYNIRESTSAAHSCKSVSCHWGLPPRVTLGYCICCKTQCMSTYKQKPCQHSTWWHGAEHAISYNYAAWTYMIYKVTWMGSSVHWYE